MTPEERTADLERRIGELERRISELMQPNGSGVLAARGFVPPDAARVVRAGFMMRDNDPAMTLMDEKGRVRATLDISRGNPGLTLLDDEGKHRALLRVDEHGPRLYFVDQRGKLTWSAP